MAAVLTPDRRVERQSSLLGHLARVPGLTAMELGRVLGIDRTTVHRELERMRQAGLVRYQTGRASGPRRFKRMWYPA